MPAPEFAKIVIKTCSLMLKGPGFIVNSNRVPLKKASFGNTLAMKCPMGTTAIWADIELTVNGIFLYQKNWFTKDSMTHAATPRTHILNVTAGIVGSSVLGTVKSTCFMEHSSLTSKESSSIPSNTSPMIILSKTSMYVWLLIFRVNSTNNWEECEVSNSNGLCACRPGVYI